MATQPQPSPDARRAVMTPEELAAFDAGKYEDIRTAPRNFSKDVLSGLA